MKVGMDIDGVLADFNAHYIKLICRCTGRDLFPPGYEPLCWEYPESLGYAKAEIGLVWDDIKASGSFWTSLPNYPDTTEIMTKLFNLRDKGHDIYFITTRVGYHCKLQTERWLYQRWGVAPTVLISKSKGMVAAGLELDMFVDDKPENCIDIVKHMGPNHTYLLDRPWNQDFDHKYIPRIKSAMEMFEREGL